MTLLFLAAVLFVQPTLASETRDRQVDQVALQSQQLAANKLLKLIQKYKGRGQEPDFLIRLAEVYQESSAIHFRIAYAQAHQSRAEPNLSGYQGVLRSQIKTLDRLITVFPDFFGMDQALYGRAKAYEELNQTDPAKSDYLKMVQKFPNSPLLLSAYLALADIAVNQNLHAEAVSYLKHIEAVPKSPYYPLAIYKLAWSYYNLKDIGQALHHLETHIAYSTRATRPSASDIALRENSLMDAVNFYFDGNEQSASTYSFDGALGYFNRIESGAVNPKTASVLGRMTVRFAKLLRSHRRDQDLANWSSILVRKEKDRAETFEVLSLLLEHQINQGQFAEASRTLDDAPSLHADQNSTKLLSDLAVKLQSQLGANKSVGTHPNPNPNPNPNTKMILGTLTHLYTVLVPLFSADDPRLSAAHLNWAEISFQLQDYKLATENYGWVVTHGKPDRAVLLKWIASRYEELKQSKEIPNQLSAVAMNPASSKVSAVSDCDLSKPAREWVVRIDDANKMESTSEEVLNHFYFESNRMIYQSGAVRLATERLTDFAISHPQTEFALPSASLVIDTLIKTGDWKATVATAQRFANLPWKDGAFQSRLKEVAGEAAFMIAQRDLPTQDRETALFTLTQFIAHYPSAKTLNAALLNRAAIYEGLYRLKEAIQDYDAYFTHGGQENKLQTRVYFLRWLVGTQSLTCTKQDLHDVCNKYQALVAIGTPPNTTQNIEPICTQAFSSTSTPKENRTLWALACLKLNTHLKIREQFTLLKHLIRGWEDLEPIVQIAILPTLSTVVPETFARARNNLKSEVPMGKLTQQTLTRRTEWIQEYEALVSNALNLPWNRIRACSLHELTGVYLDFIHDLDRFKLASSPSTVEEVQAFTKPLQKKANDLADKAYQIASESSIEARDWKSIEGATRDSQSRGDEFKKEFSNRFPKFLPKSLLDLEPKPVYWVNVEANVQVEPKNQALLQNWAQSFKSRNWPLNAYFFQELRENKALPQSSVQLLQGTILAASGAQSEGLVEFQNALNSLSSPERASTRREIRGILLSNTIYTRALEKSIQLALQLEKESEK